MYQPHDAAAAWESLAGAIGRLGKTWRSTKSKSIVICVGDGVRQRAPGTFEMDDESIATVTNPDGNTPEEILAAAQSCPVDAIILTDAATGEKVWPQG